MGLTHKGHAKGLLELVGPVHDLIEGILHLTAPAHTDVQKGCCSWVHALHERLQTTPGWMPVLLQPLLHVSKACK